MGIRTLSLAMRSLVASIFFLVSCDPTGGGSKNVPDDANVSPTDANVSPRDASIGPRDAGTGPTSIEFGRALYGTDFTTRSDAPSGGTLFSVWSKVMDSPPTVFPWARGNLDVYVLYGPGWHMRCLTGNLTVPSASTVYYNANVMVFTENTGTWLDDYAVFFDTPPDGAASAYDWVWAAWQVVVESDRFTIRQWLKFGIDGAVFAAGEDRPTFVSMRNRLVAVRGWTRAAADAWVPRDATHFQVGGDHGYLVQARMTATRDVPSLASLDMVARATAPVSTAWAAYDLDWVDGGANLSDRSGHGRHLTLEAGGALYPGVPGPPF